MGRLFYEEVVLHLAFVSQLSGGPELALGIVDDFFFPQVSKEKEKEKKKEKKRKTGNTLSGSRLQHTLALQSA